MNVLENWAKLISYSVLANEKNCNTNLMKLLVCDFIKEQQGALEIWRLSSVMSGEMVQHTLYTSTSNFFSNSPLTFGGELTEILHS